MSHLVCVLHTSFCLLQSWIFAVCVCVRKHGCSFDFSNFPFHVRSSFAWRESAGFGMGKFTRQLANRGEQGKAQSGCFREEHHTSIYGDVGVISQLLHAILCNDLHHESLLVL